METPASRLLLGILPWYSVLIVTGMVLAIVLACREEQRIGLKKDTVIDLCLWMLPVGILGARLYFVLFSWDNYRDNPISALYIWEGGLAIYGGILAGLITALIFARRRSISLLTLLDLIAPGLAMAQGIGRWGNYFNQEAYGIAVTDPRWQFFPVSVLIHGQEWHLATFFYESVLDFAILAFLLFLRHRKSTRRGDLIGWYTLIYAAGRLVIEDLRTDSLMFSENIRISQLLSALACLIVLYLFFRRNRGTQNPLQKVIRVLLPVFQLALFANILPHLMHAKQTDGQYTLILLRFALFAVFTGACLYFIKDKHPSSERS